MRELGRNFYFFPIPIQKGFPKYFFAFSPMIRHSGIHIVDTVVDCISNLADCACFVDSSTLLG